MFSSQEISLLEKYQVPCESTPGFVTNFIGVKTSIQYLPGIQEWSGKTIPGIPDPDDGMHAEGAEYLALFHALENTASRELVCAELGAGWGPWLAAAGVVSKRMDFDHVKLIGVEASKKRYHFLREHLTTNHLLADPKVECVLLEGAAWENDGVVFFPDQDTAHDYGPAASNEVDPLDYRGQHLGQREVKAYSLETIFGDSKRINFLHIDIQGGELALCQAGIGILNERVEHLFIGTHSRKIEGDLFDLFYANGWQLLRETPCQFSHAWQGSTLEALTLSDGSQYWVNSNPSTRRASHDASSPAQKTLHDDRGQSKDRDLEKQVSKLNHRVEVLTGRVASQKNALQYHSANPLRALRLWWNRPNL